MGDINVVRVVVNGWTWVRGETNNTTHAKRMLSEAFNEGDWPQEPVDVTITPGGFIIAPFPPEYDGACSWESDEDFERLIPAASREVEKVIGTDRMMARLKKHTRLLTLGVDLFLEGGMKTTHAEMVAVINTNTGKVIHWTGKSYPEPKAKSPQESTLVHAPLASHCFTFYGTPMLILGCHDLHLLSNRSWANVDEDKPRHERCKEMRRLARKLKPVAVLQHPHATDTSRTWSTAWAGVREYLPTAKTCASAIAYCNRYGEEEREPLGTVMEKTAWGDVVNIVVEGC